MPAGEVLCATDGSPDSRAAVRAGSRLAAASGARLMLAHALPTGPELYGMPVPEEFRQTAEGHAKRVLKAAGDDVVAAAGEPGFELLRGEPGHALVERAGRAGVELVAIGARDPSRRSAIGPVCEAVVHHAPCPVLVCRQREGAEAGAYGTIAVGTDGSGQGGVAVERAAGLARALDAELVVITVAERPVVLVGTYFPEDLTAPLEQAAREVLDEAEGRAAAIAPRVRKALAEGTPREALVESAANESAGLLVVGTRGLGVVRRLLLGSTSDYALRHAGCDVLVVRSQ